MIKLFNETAGATLCTRFTSTRLARACATAALAISCVPASYAEVEEIIVTARKRDESAQDIPVVVSAMSGEQLQRRQINSIEKVAEAVPQFVVARGTTGSGSNLSIRGVGSNFTSIGIEQSVSVNVDGVYQGQGRVLNEGMFDLKQVEILKGPQALFFGKNATAGVLSLNTADPGKEFEAMVRTGYEVETEEYNVEGHVSGPISDALGARLAFTYSNMQDGLRQNLGDATSVRTQDLGAGGAQTVYAVSSPDDSLPQTEKLGGRFTLAYEPTEDFSMRLKATYSQSESNSGGWANELWHCPFGTSQLSPGADCDGDWRIYDIGLPGSLVADNPLLSENGGDNYEDSDSYHLTGIVHYETDFAAIDWVTGYQDFQTKLMLKSDTTPNMNRGTYAGTDTGYKAGSTELRAQTKLDLPVNFMGGVYYQASELDFQQDIIFPGNDSGLRVDSTATDPSTRILTVRKLGNTDGTTFGAFGQLIWNFLPDWELTAGGRYTRETKDSDFYQPYVISAFRAVFRQYDPANPLSRFDYNQKWNDFSPEVMLSWHPLDDVLVFAGYKTGYKSGGFSISALNSSGTKVGDLAFEPEEAEGFEAGVKATVLDNQLRLALSLYSYEYTDLQVDFFNSAITTFVTYNAGSAESRGAEFEGEWAPTAVDGLVVRGTVSYGDSYYSDFDGAPCFAGQTPTMGCLAATAAIPYVHQDLEDEDTALAPSWTASLGVEYERPVGAGLLLGASGNLKYSDDYNLSPFANPAAVQDSYATLDAGLRLRDEQSRWEVAVIGKNLTDEYVLTYSQDAPSTGSGTGTAAGVPADQFGFPLPGRTVALQFTAWF